MWLSYYRSTLMKATALEEFAIESDDESEAGSDYDELCNTSISNRGYWNKLCKNGLSRDILEKEGWQFQKTDGKNSYIFIKNNRVLKLQRQNDKIDKDQDDLCLRFLSTIEHISTLKKYLGNLLPTIYKVIICKYSNNTNLMILMKWAGYVNTPMNNVTDRMISNAANILVKSNIYSLDILTSTFHVNHGNFAFKVSKNNRLLVKFIDFDDYNQFKDSSDVPRDYLKTIWVYIIKNCLNKPTHTLNYYEYETKLSSNLHNLFS